MGRILCCGPAEDVANALVQRVGDHASTDRYLAVTGDALMWDVVCDLVASEADFV